MIEIEAPDDSQKQAAYVEKLALRLSKGERKERIYREVTKKVSDPDERESVCNAVGEKAREIIAVRKKRHNKIGMGFIVASLVMLVVSFMLGDYIIFSGLFLVGITLIIRSGKTEDFTLDE